MRVGIVGTGSMGRTHAAAWANTPATISGFLSRSPERASPLATTYNARIYRDLATLINEVDIVDICTPTHLHHEMVLATAAAGRHVICEKPLARTIAQAREMIAACEMAGVHLLVAHVVRYFPEYAAARQTLASGALGQPAIIRLKRGSAGPDLSGSSWFNDAEKSGGLILDMMIHDFDYARWLAGEITQVYAQSVRHNQAGQGRDHCLAILTHESGTLSHIEGSWAYPAPLFYTQIEIAGSDGWLTYDSEQAKVTKNYLYQTAASLPAVPLPANPLREDPYTTQLRAFYDTIVGGHPTRISPQDGLAALQIGLAALESARTGQPVQLGKLAA